ncbi:hypothetical protein [Pleionea litopenaei]|uniref:Uncharacterized protein n=1 Tax=Pleionea litopenaei TaxID=3070815 RepID=A0AA51X6D3_9GAMM|nr:hypothetical protein [Pleionea sp. HL-JVS1]WMS87008.1 hypothetical protein Q9312_17475 [Pleionea sp. HL-JVS1]
MKALTRKVAHSLIEKIVTGEKQAAKNDTLVSCDNYLTLARLYNSELDYAKEINVLQRFLDLGRAVHEDLALVERQLSEAKAAQHEQRQIDKLNLNTQNEPSVKEASKTPLRLQDESGSESIWNTTETSQEREKLTPRDIINPTNKPIDAIKMVTVCAAYTGKTEDDELFELALVSFQYCRNNDTVIKILDEYHGSRKTKKPIPIAAVSRLSASHGIESIEALNQDRVNTIMENVESVISHNDPYIERQHFICLFPHFEKLAWRSSQLDIPWSALGFKDRGLSKILNSYSINRPNRTPQERAKAIVRLLSQHEPGTQSSFFKRLLNCQPMKAFEWSKALKSTSDKLTKKRFGFGFRKNN